MCAMAAAKALIFLILVHTCLSSTQTKVKASSLQSAQGNEIVGNHSEDSITDYPNAVPAEVPAESSAQESTENVSDQGDASPQVTDGQPFVGSQDKELPVAPSDAAAGAPATQDKVKAAMETAKQEVQKALKEVDKDRVRAVIKNVGHLMSVGSPFKLPVPNIAAIPSPLAFDEAFWGTLAHYSPEDSFIRTMSEARGHYMDRLVNSQHRMFHVE